MNPELLEGYAIAICAMLDMLVTNIFYEVRKCNTIDKKCGNMKLEGYFDIPLGDETVLTANAGECTDESLIRKVSRPNPDYVLRQPGAVLNWCDVSQKEGFFCLNDRFWDLPKTPAGLLWLGKLLVQVVKKLCAPKKNTSSASGIFVFHKDITVLQYFALLDQINVHFDKDELLRINDQLSKIKKPRH